MLNSVTAVLPSRCTVRSYFMPLPSSAGVTACDRDDGCCIVCIVAVVVTAVMAGGFDEGSDACPAVNASVAESSEDATTATSVIPAFVVAIASEDEDGNEVGDDDNSSLALSITLEGFSSLLLLEFTCALLLLLLVLGAPNS